jgi:hypothetical protein
MLVPLSRYSLFWQRVERLQNGCWLWKGGHSIENNQRRPYGRFKIKGKYVFAHRFSFQMKYGEIPKDKVLDHICNNTMCVNPDHLQIVTIKENILKGNGFGAINKRKEFCPKGHPLKEGNLVSWALKQNKRLCLTCYPQG